MVLDLFLKRGEADLEGSSLAAGGRRIPLVMVRNYRARRYLLRLRPDGSARLTIPRRGSAREGRQFAERNTEWLARQLERLPAYPVKPQQWLVGTEILFRGEMVRIEAGANGESGAVRCGGEVVRVPDVNGDLRPWIARHLWRLAAREFPARVLEFAAAHQLTVGRVSVRNQRSRWGSCSRRGTVSLNWRLIQTPPFVRDYILLHELTHLRHMNHSARYWQEVAGVCPGYEAAESWLKEHAEIWKNNSRNSFPSNCANGCAPFHRTISSICAGCAALKCAQT
jgi:predicted metal-dependent hydrolase